MEQKSDWTWKEIKDNAVKEYQRGYYDGTISALISIKSMVQKEIDEAKSWYNKTVSERK